MKKASLIICVLVSFNLTMNGQVNSDAFNQLKAIDGSWVVRSENTIMTEIWNYVNDSLIEGSVRMTDLDGNLLFTEKLAIRKSKKAINYYAAVSNQNESNEIPFELKSTIDLVFVFENIKHDFPQRIVYDLSVPNKISAYIEGELKGELKRSDFKFDRLN